MTVSNQITQQNPSNGSLPSEQTAKNAKGNDAGKQSRGQMTESDRLVYQLVENSVSYAGDQFGENLKFNSETLTNVLYDNIYKILGEKFNGEEFADLVSDKLVEQGAVVKEQKADDKQKPQEEQVVYDLDDSEYKELVSKVDATIEILKANRLNIFKAFNRLNESVEENGKIQSEDIQKQNETIRLKRDRQITILVERLRGNQQKMDDYATYRAKAMDKSSGFIDEQKSSAEVWERDSKIAYSGLRKTIRQLGVKTGEVNQDYRTLGDSKLKQTFKVFKDFGGKKQKAQEKSGTKLKKKGVLKKKTPVSRIVSGKTKNTKIFRLIQSISGAVSRTLGTVKKTVGTVFNIGKKMASATFKTAKFAGKAFLKASRIVGKVAVKATVAVGKFIKKAVMSGGKSIVKMINVSSGAKLITAIGIKGIKLIGKSLWRGIKKIAKSMFSSLKKLFKFTGKFVNKASTFLKFIGSGIEKAYKFMVQPIANVLVTIFGFVTGVLKQPVEFMKFMIPTLFERIMNIISSVKQYSKRVLHATWSIFRKILFNPISMMLIVGGLFVVFGPKIFEWFHNIVHKIVYDFIPSAKRFVTGAIEVLTPVWTCLKTVGTFLFNVIEWLTRPNNFLGQAIRFLVTFNFKLKNIARKMMKIGGVSTIDTLCMFIAGDWLGIALHTIVGSVKALWNMIKDKGPVKIMLKLIKFVLGLYKMILTMPLRLVESITGALGAIVTGNWGDVPEKFTRPWKEWWDQVVSIFKGDEPKKSTDEIMAHDPLKDNQKIADQTSESVSRLGIKGMKSATTLKKMDEISRMSGFAENKNMLSRIQQMEKMYQINSKQVAAFNNFLSDIWKMAGDKNADDGESYRVLSMLLQDPDFSEKILSVFFYYNPQTAETMTLWPMANIEKFIGNLQGLMTTDGSWKEKFKMFVDALDQLNKERSHIVNNQGTQITKFANNIQDIDVNKKESQKKMKMLVEEFNKGDLFKNISAQSSFEQMSRGNSKSQNLTGKSGDKFGSKGNKLISESVVAPKNSGLNLKDFKPAPPPEDNYKILGNVTGTPAMLSRSALPADADSHGRSRAEVEKYKDYINERENLVRNGWTADQLKEAGYGPKTIDEWIEDRKTPEQRQKEFEVKRSRMSAMRNAAAIELFQRRGQQLTGSDPDLMYMKLQKNAENTGTFFNAEGQGLTKDLYLFSKDWEMITGQNSVSEEQVEQLAEGTRTFADQEVARKSQEEYDRQIRLKKEKERQKQILDYSAQVRDGFIEVKVGEDKIAMKEAFKMHNKKREQFIREGWSKEQLEKAGLKLYTWNEWVKYYRKMHGIPEDGIKRIPFKGKKKERVIDWGTRYALATDEIEKYGIKMSENGPVMIPLEKAMQAASALFSGAINIHTIRDGLEVMRIGLENETKKLKEEKVKPKVGVVQNQESGGGEVVVPQPANPSNYQEVG